MLLDHDSFANYEMLEIDVVYTLVNDPNEVALDVDNVIDPIMEIFATLIDDKVVLQHFQNSIYEEMATPDTLVIEPIDPNDSDSTTKVAHDVDFFNDDDQNSN